MSRKDVLNAAVLGLQQPGTTEPNLKDRLKTWSIQLARIMLVVLTLGVLFWVSTDTRYRDSDGFPLGTICLPISASVSLLVLAWRLGTIWQRFAVWFSIALVGQSVALQLIDAGPLIHYQHYKPLDVVAIQSPWLILFIFLQSVLVIVGLASHFNPIRNWLAGAFRPWQLFSIACVFALSTAALSRNVGGYAIEVIFATWLQLISLGALVLAVWALPSSAVSALSRKVRYLARDAAIQDCKQRNSLDRFAFIAAIGVTSVAALLCLVSYQAHPHIPDEVAYLLHARFLAIGAWSLPAPPIRPAFEIYLMQFQSDQWFAATPPGWPAMLSLGVRLGVPWLVNPVLAGLNILLSYLLIQEIFDRYMARVAVLLLAVSPWFLFMGMNFMTHTYTLTCALAAALMIAWAKRQKRILWAFVAGGFVGAGSLIRPLDGLVVGVLLGAWLFTVQGWRTRAFFMMAFLVGTIIVGAAVLPYNQALTASPTTFPLNAYLDEQFGPGKNDLGFGDNRGYGWALQPLPGHSPLGALINTALNIFSLNTELFGWSIGSLLFITLFLVSHNLRRQDYLLLAVIGVTLGTFSLYWYSGGPDFGARYWYLIIIPCVLLTLRGIQRLVTKLAYHSNGLKNARGYVTATILLLAVLSVINYIPWRALDKYHHYLLMRPDIQNLANTYPFAGSLVLIRGAAFPDFASALVYDPLDWHIAAPVYAWAKNGETVDALLRAFPDRMVWVVDGPSKTEGGYRVVAGPLTPSFILGHPVSVPEQ